MMDSFLRALCVYGPIVFAAVVAAIGTIGSIVTHVRWRRGTSLATGRVVEIETHKRIEETTYQASIEFEVDGVTHRIHEQSTTIPGLRRVGWFVKLRYPPGRPDLAMTDETITAFWQQIFVATLGWIFLIALGCLYWWVSKL